MKSGPGLAHGLGTILTPLVISHVYSLPEDNALFTSPIPIGYEYNTVLSLQKII